MKQTFPTVLAAVITVALAVGAGSASATTFSGSVTDPANGRYAANDVLAETMSFDNVTGTWRTTIAFRGKALSTTNVQIYLDFSWQRWISWSPGDYRDLFYEIAVRNGKMTFVDRTVRMFGCKPKVTLSRPDKVLLAKIVAPCMAGVVPIKSAPTRLSYKTIIQNFISGFDLLPQP